MKNILGSAKQRIVLLATLGLSGGMLLFSSPVAQAATCVRQEWGFGSSGSCVEDIQSMLNTIGFFFYYKNFSTLAIDGQFGSLTEGQVKAFQAFTNNTQDGIVGLSTWGSICSEAKFVHQNGQTRADSEIIITAKAAGCAWAQ